jgi:hypothetical protein
MAKVQNLYIDQGADFSITFNMQNDDTTPYDLTNCTITSYLKKSYTANTHYSFNIGTLDTSGNITLSLTPVQTSNVISGNYLYDVYLYVPSANTTTKLVEGTVYVSPQVSK